MTSRQQRPRVAVVLARVSESLRDLADASFQRRVWIEGSPTEVSSLNEVVSALFDDSGLRDAIDRGQQVYSPEIDHSLAVLDKHLKPIVDRLWSLTSEDLSTALETDEWRAVRAEAARLLAAVEATSAS